MEFRRNLVNVNGVLQMNGINVMGFLGEVPFDSDLNTLTDQGYL